MSTAQKAKVDAPNATAPDAAIPAPAGRVASEDPPAFDEMVTGQGVVRRHWQPLLASLSLLGPNGLVERAERGRQHLEDEGVTYNLYELPSDPAGRGAPDIAPPLPEQRPWRLDPVPVLLSAEEWAGIEAGLIQRAELLDRMLRDFYGPMNLLREGRYPPALVYGHRDFLRAACRTDGSMPGRMLQHYAAELVRGPDGIWRVIADRSQAPAGAGYALQNRRVMSRLMGQALRECRTRPLTRYFDFWQSDLQARGQHMSDNPRVVLLTPGPYNEAYFEHIYLARELGATLVEGADLTMRDGRVFIKTLAGLEPVDVILRRLDGEWCDPLELRAESALGVTGLMQAVREGRVAMCNGIGSGLAEQPAMQAFLPTLAEHLLGETLKLPSVATWWCGQSYALREVENRFDDMVVRGARDLRALPLSVRDLSDAARAQLLARIKARPGDYVAQERTVPSVAPGLGANGKLEPTPILLRVQVVADGDGYVVMPGGLARVPQSGDPFRATMQRGGVNKDVWVEATDPGPLVIRGNAPRQRLQLRRTSGTLQSRVADDLFWLGRSVERLDDGARLLRATLTRLVGELGSARDMVEMGVLARALSRCGLIDQRAAAAPPDSKTFAQAVARAAASNQMLGQTLDAMERLAAVARHRFSADMWRLLNHLLGELRLSRTSAEGDPDAMLEFCDQMIRTTAAIAGMLAEHMTRGSGWRFLDFGRRLERAIYISRSVSAATTVLTTAPEPGFRIALELNDSSLTYRRRYRASLQPAAVFDLLLLDGSNPHALGFQLNTMSQHLDILPRRDQPPRGEDCLALGKPFEDIVEKFDRDEVPAAEWQTLVSRLRGSLDATTQALMDISDQLTRTYFSHIQLAQSFGFGR
ncbi:circularly permuted type 2 ATP-grasp protein [Ferrovibrio sp.]|uniref:circularly permuted type 2 ATP-grasp protein n=1 Tax=Ferrovibrio sp. TaxID=1917215 RepID=UPI0025BC1EE9|nr:circularly permuted type 2 ATP-grasp protein [Ferrovibrio sp.]MBX3453808.1 circularly permuted type 2 ATP-grasp protein [Ferrovibrio sp.]